jgi:hypothetical protein
VRADADARIGDDQVRSAEAIDKVAGGDRGRFCVRDIERIGDDGAGERQADVPARDQAENRVRRGVVPRQRLADARRGAGDDDSLYLPFRTWSMR